MLLAVKFHVLVLAVQSHVVKYKFCCFGYLFQVTGEDRLKDSRTKKLAHCVVIGL